MAQFLSNRSFARRNCIVAHCVRPITRRRIARSWRWSARWPTRRARSAARGLRFSHPARRRSLGVMEFFSYEIRQPDQDLLDMMATIGSQIGQFIERKRAEDALHRAQMELAHVTRVATLGEMTASIAHEVNQPLTAVIETPMPLCAGLPQRPQISMKAGRREPHSPRRQSGR